MKWLTLTEIGRRSRSKKGALEVSYEHWNQLYTATAKELRTEIKRTGKQLSRGMYCGLCNYNRNRCINCILRECGFLWVTANSELLDWYNKEEDGDWHFWKRACKALRDKLKELIEQE